MKLIIIAGARPNFIKISPLIKAIKHYNTIFINKINYLLVHTGQHYDIRMSDTFFESLAIPLPDFNLEIGSGTHAEQVGYTMIEFEKILKLEKPDWVIVVGDVNATMACSITAKKEGVKCCHIEAGLRSGDMSMPEEINRLVTDRLSDLLLTPDKISSQNLIFEGIDKNKIVFVGNIMIDTLEENREMALKLCFEDILSSNIINENLNKIDHFKRIDKYGLVTMHRPSNVDNKLVFENIINWMINDASEKIPLIWPIHPRTIKQAQNYNLWEKLINCRNILLLYPIGYHEMLNLNFNTNLMLTDSGGLQEECCVLGTPFLTLRWNTERPITLLEFGGAGFLVGNNIDIIKRDFNKILLEKRNPIKPELWDGKTAERCLNALLNFKD